MIAGRGHHKRTPSGVVCRCVYLWNERNSPRVAARHLIGAARTIVCKKRTDDVDIRGQGVKIKACRATSSQRRLTTHLAGPATGSLTGHGRTTRQPHACSGAGRPRGGGSRVPQQTHAPTLGGFPQTTYEQEGGFLSPHCYLLGTASALALQSAGRAAKCKPSACAECGHAATMHGLPNPSTKNAATMEVVTKTNNVMHVEGHMRYKAS